MGPRWRRLWLRWRPLVWVLAAIGLYARFYYVNPGGTMAWTLLIARQTLAIAFAIFVVLIQFIAIFWFLGRAQIYWVRPGETGITFDDYRGNPEVLEQARRVVTLLKGVKGFKEMGGEVSRGMLLVGPPGTGKSYLAQAIATEAGLPFGYLSAASVTGDTPILIRHQGKTRVVPIGEFVDAFYPGEAHSYEVPIEGYETLGYTKDPLTARGDGTRVDGVGWSRVRGVYRHPASEIYRIEYTGGGVIRVTGDHSLFVRRPSGVYPVAACDLKPGDFLVSLPYLKFPGDPLRQEPAGPGGGVEPCRVVSITRHPYAGFVYDLCGCDNEAFFGGNVPILLHNSIQNMFFGVSNLRIMNMYRKARRLAMDYGACIVFLDEFDAIGMSRTRQQAGAAFPIFGGMGLLNELLLQMDPPRFEARWWARILRWLGFRPGPGPQPIVFTMAATNVPEVLDPALLRPGRFDRQIVVQAPDFEGRKEVIAYYLAKVAHDPSLDGRLDELSADMVGYTPAKVKHVINEAVIKAHFDGRSQITYEDITYAREVHEMGLKQPLRSMLPEERRRLAYHEAGHAVAQLRLLPHERVVKTTIVRHGQALGFSATRPTVERLTQSQEEILARIQVSLASRAAEELFLGTRLSGAVGDLETATRLAAAYIGSYGMDGTLYSYQALNPAAPDDELKSRINRLLDREKSKVSELLRAQAPLVHAIARKLLERDELTGGEIQELAGLFDAGRLGPDGSVLPPPADGPVAAEVQLGAASDGTPPSEQVDGALDVQVSPALPGLQKLPVDGDGDVGDDRTDQRPAGA